MEPSKVAQICLPRFASNRQQLICQHILLDLNEYDD